MGRTLVRFFRADSCGRKRPGDPEVPKSISLEAVFEWLRDCPEQIERAVIMGC
jgi:hypothetical protein